MTRGKLSNRLLATAAASVALGLFAAARTAQAVPVSGDYHEDPRCDVIANQQLSHELGRLAFFPTNESFEVQFAATNTTVCVPNDGLANDWNVQIRNVSGIPWQNLFFVVDVGATLGNADGTVQDLVGAPGVFTDAMKIDGTVTAGANNNLFFESGPVDEIFSPGETWRFNVSNFVTTSGGPPIPPLFTTPGRFAGSSPLSIQTSASILAVPVPEPTTITIGALVAAGILMRRPRRAH